MKTASGLPKKPWKDNHHPSKQVTESISKTNSQANGTSNGDWDTGLSILSIADITSTLKIKLLEKQGHATSRM